MSYNSQYTGQQAEELLQKASVIQTNGDAEKFLAGDGTYKEVNPGVQSYRVLTLNGTAPLKIGEKVQGLSYGYSAQSGELTPADLNVNEVFVFHAPILNNEGEQRTLDCIGIKFSENELDVVSTTMIGTTNDSAINHYVVNIYYDIAADEISYLIQDMNEIGNGGEVGCLDMSIFDLSDGDSGTLSDESYQKVVDAFNNRVIVGAIQESFAPISISDLNDKYEIYINVNGPGESYLGVGIYIYSINKSDKTFTFTGIGAKIETGGDGTKFLSDDGTYKAVSSGSASGSLLTQEEQNAILDAINAVKFDDGYTVNQSDLKTGTITEEQYSSIINAIPDKVKSSQGVIWFITSSGVKQSILSSGMTNGYIISCYLQYADGGFGVWSYTPYNLIGNMVFGGLGSANAMALSVQSDRSYTLTIKSVSFDNSGDGTKFLSDDGTYKTASSVQMKVLAESEYSALGDAVNTDGVLYFVTPDETGGGSNVVITSVAVEGEPTYGTPFTVKATGENLDSIQLEYGIAQRGSDQESDFSQIQWQTSNIFNISTEYNVGFQFYACARIQGDNSTAKQSDEYYTLKQKEIEL